MFLLRARDSNLNREIKYGGSPSFEDALDCQEQEIEDCLEALNCSEPGKFDAHVGETNCQTRAYMVAVLMGRRTNRQKLKQILEEKKEAIANLRLKLKDDREVRIFNERDTNYVGNH